MATEIKETAANSPVVIDYQKVFDLQQQPWTIKSLGVELQKEDPVTKNDSEQIAG